MDQNVEPASLVQAVILRKYLAIRSLTLLKCQTFPKQDLPYIHKKTRLSSMIFYQMSLAFQTGGKLLQGLTSSK